MSMLSLLRLTDPSPKNVRLEVSDWMSSVTMTPFTTLNLAEMFLRRSLSACPPAKGEMKGLMMMLTGPRTGMEMRLPFSRAKVPMVSFLVLNDAISSALPVNSIFPRKLPCWTSSKL